MEKTDHQGSNNFSHDSQNRQLLDPIFHWYHPSEIKSHNLHENADELATLFIDLLNGLD